MLFYARARAATPFSRAPARPREGYNLYPYFFIPRDLERPVVRPRHDAPPVRGDGDAADLRRSQIITKVQRTPQRTQFECPSSVATHLPVATSHTLSVLSFDADTTRRPSGNTATLRPTTNTHHHKSTVDAATHDHRVPFQRRHAFAGRHVPHLERVVARRRHDAPPVRKHGNARTYDEARSSQKYSGRRNARGRVPFQRRHAFAGRHVPHLERVVVRRRHDAPPVRKHGNAKDLRRSQIITKVQWTPQRTPIRVPFQRRHALAGRHVPDLERVVARRRHDAPPVRKHGNAMDLRRSQIITKVQWTPQRTLRRVPFQRRHAFAGRNVPHLERVVARRRNDAPPVRKHGNAIDLRRSQIITKVQWTPQRTSDECPSSVATHSPVATSHTLIVLSEYPRRHDAPPVRKHGNAIDLRRSQIITKVQRTPQRT